MAKVPVVTARQAETAFNRVGYFLSRIKGSHRILRHPEREHNLTLPGPENRRLAKGMLRALIRTAGLTVDEFSELLE